MALDKRLHLFAVIDTETAGTLDDPLVYDFAIAICDKAGKIYFKENWIVEETFNDLALMEGAYFFSKYPTYKRMVEENPSMLQPWEEIRWRVRQILSVYNVKTLCAYNLRFDLKAIMSSMLYLNKENEYFFPYGLKKQDIWSLFCDTVAIQKTFRHFAISARHVKQTGRLTTTAEVAYRYISVNSKFKEEHTAMADVEIEVAILARCLAQHKKYRRGCPKFPSTSLPLVTDLDRVKAKRWRGRKLTGAEVAMLA